MKSLTHLSNTAVIESAGVRQRRVKLCSVLSSIWSYSYTAGTDRQHEASCVLSQWRIGENIYPFGATASRVSVYLLRRRGVRGRHTPPRASSRHPSAQKNSVQLICATGGVQVACKCPRRRVYSAVSRRAEKHHPTTTTTSDTHCVSYLSSRMLQSQDTTLRVLLMCDVANNGTVEPGHTTHMSQHTQYDVMDMLCT